MIQFVTKKDTYIQAQFMNVYIRNYYKQYKEVRGEDKPFLFCFVLLSIEYDLFIAMSVIFEKVNWKVKKYPYQIY